jgi:hypothetical protein
MINGGFLGAGGEPNRDSVAPAECLIAILKMSLCKFGSVAWAWSAGGPS